MSTEDQFQKWLDRSPHQKLLEELIHMTREISGLCGARFAYIHRMKDPQKRIAIRIAAEDWDAVTQLLSQSPDEARYERLSLPSPADNRWFMNDIEIVKL